MSKQVERGVLDGRVGPPPRVRKYHYAAKVRGDGRVSALCFPQPRAIDLKRALWTTDPAAVTCAACSKLLPVAAPTSASEEEAGG